jgi:class 3 adenylate cyclase
VDFAYRYVQAAVSPTGAGAPERLNMNIDTRAIAPLIHVPTLVINATNDPVSPVGGAEWLARMIPTATLVTFEAASHSGLTDDDEVLARIEEFVTGVRPTPDAGRVLATVLFTDIVGSTETASRLGDKRWTSLLREHDRRTHEQAARYHGQVIKSTGDGALATFDGPERAVRCAAEIVDTLGSLGISVRAGLHSGEVVQSGADVSGIAVHLAARVMALAPAGHVPVSRTVHDLVVGSSLRFSDAGSHPLKGIEGDWQLYKVV